tara:strand:+ start:330 stop:587 length:258 start_codon:yes stop_codon:yes gene_type:complete
LPFEIIGKTKDELLSLLSMLKTGTTKSRHVYSRPYEVDDILLFDNFSTMHRTKEQTDAADRPDSDYSKLLWRLSAKGTPNVIKKS